MTEVVIDGLAIAWDERVLEPRPWTAAQSAWAASLLPDLPSGPVLEVCSGAGHIGLLAVRSSDRELVQVDVDEVACDFARANAERAGLADRVTVRCGPMDEAVGADERFPLVIADPPWVPSPEVDHFPEDPVTAIDGGPAGLDIAFSCLTVAGRTLVAGGVCLIQLGTVEQADEVGALLREQPSMGLVAGELREYDRGCVLRLDRADPAAGAAGSLPLPGSS